MNEVQVHVTRDVPFAVARVWGLLADFGYIGWTPGFEKVDVIGSGPGMIRRIFMPGMAPIDEVLESIDNAALTFSYSMPRGIPFPVSCYRGNVQLEELPGAHTRIHWNGHAAPKGVSGATIDQILRGQYEQVLDWLEAHLRDN